MSSDHTLAIIKSYDVSQVIPDGLFNDINAITIDSRKPFVNLVYTDYEGPIVFVSGIDREENNDALRVVDGLLDLGVPCFLAFDGPFSIKQINPNASVGDKIIVTKTKNEILADEHSITVYLDSLYNMETCHVLNYHSDNIEEAGFDIIFDGGDSMLNEGFN